MRAGPRGERGVEVEADWRREVVGGTAGPEEVVDDCAGLEADRRREVVDGTAGPEARSVREITPGLTGRGPWL